MEETSLIKEQLVRHLKGGEAFTPIEEIIKKISFDKLGERPSNLPYSFYELFYHIWFAQKDILDYCKAKEFSPHDWPKDYWPQKQVPDTLVEWQELQQAFFNSREELILFLEEKDNALLNPVREKKEHTVLREILLVLEHNAYHTGQLFIVARLLAVEV